MKGVLTNRTGTELMDTGRWISVGAGGINMDTPGGVSFKYSETGKRIRLRLKPELVSDKRNVLRIGGFSEFCHPDQGEAAWRDLRTKWLHSRWEMRGSFDSLRSLRMTGWSEVSNFRRL